MKRIFLVLASVMLFGGACRTLVHMQQSAFFSRFLLDRSVTATAYKGIDATRGPGGTGGSIGGTTGGIGPGRQDVSSSSTSTIGFTIRHEGENKFEEGEFIGALAAQIKKEIEKSHANITANGTPASNEFYVDYTDGNIKGRITISGSASGSILCSEGQCR